MKAEMASQEVERVLLKMVRIDYYLPAAINRLTRAMQYLNTSLKKQEELCL